jgi:maleate cis-trans isomerase
MRTIERNPFLDGVKVGLIVPSVNTTTEPEFSWMAPRNVSFHAARVFMNTTTPDALRAMNAEVRDAGRLLATLSPDVVAYACTAGSFIDGLDATHTLVEELRGVVGCPVVATSIAMIEALRELGVSRVALATPYPRDVSELEAQFLAGNGFKVVSHECLGRSGADVRPTQFDEIIDLVQRVDRPEAQAIFVSCTDLRALEVIRELERQLAKPILTSNQVTFWAVMRTLNISARIDDFGMLLERVVS